MLRGEAGETSVISSSPLPELETASGLLSQAFAHHRSGNLASAARAYRQSIAFAPNDVDGLNGFAAAELACRRPRPAECVLSRAGAIAPTDARLIVNRALAAIDCGQATAKQLAKALALAPAMASVLEAVSEQASTQRLAWLDRALASEPSVGRRLRLATGLAKAGRRERARRLCQVALVSDPGNPDLLNGLGGIDYDAGDLEMGISGFNRAWACDRLHPAAWSNLALARHDAGHLGAAVQAGRRAITLDPALADAHANLANAAFEAISPEAAVLSLRRAFRLQPDRRSFLSNLVMALSYIPGETRHQAEVARAWWERQGWAPARPGRAASRAGRLRIGYVSSFSLASTRHLGLAAVSRHDPEKVDLFAYTQRRRGSADPDLGPALRGLRDITALTDDAAARLVEADGLDVLVDLCGHTPGNRLGVFAFRPATVQMTWIESFFTTGLPAIDWFITDRDHSPSTQMQVFAERLLDIGRPRFCYAPPEPSPDPMPPPSRRKGHVTFGCFNYPPKIGKAVVELWASILHAVPRSRLRLKWWSMTEPSVAALVRARFASCGIGPERLDLAGASSHAAMLEEYGEVDVALDPFPFTGGVTTCEALWMGVPVVSLAGASVIERQSSCLLRAAGAGDLATGDMATYRGIAIATAEDEAGRAKRRTELRQSLRTSPLTDVGGTARALEVAYLRALNDR